MLLLMLQYRHFGAIRSKALGKGENSCTALDNADDGKTKRNN